MFKIIADALFAQLEMTVSNPNQNNPERNAHTTKNITGPVISPVIEVIEKQSSGHPDCPSNKKHATRASALFQPAKFSYFSQVAASHGDILRCGVNVSWRVLGASRATGSLISILHAAPCAFTNFRALWFAGHFTHLVWAVMKRYAPYFLPPDPKSAWQI
jgi:hypothetical protein